MRRMGMHPGCAASRPSLVHHILTTASNAGRDGYLCTAWGTRNAEAAHRKPYTMPEQGV
jgi:hypothetical protein